MHHARLTPGREVVEVDVAALRALGGRRVDAAARVETPKPADSKNELDRAPEHLADTDTHLDTLGHARAATRWNQRSQRAEIDRLAEGWQRGRGYWAGRVDELTHELERRPAAQEPTLSRARDPLIAVEHSQKTPR